MKKAQSSAEFVIITGAVLFFFVGFVGLIYVSIEKKNYEKKDIALSIEVEYLADEISLAYEAGAGYQRTFDLPNTILGTGYHLEIVEGDSIYAYTNEVPPKHATSVSSLKVSYTVTTPGVDKLEIIETNPITITNNEGVVTITQ